MRPRRRPRAAAIALGVAAATALALPAAASAATLVWGGSVGLGSPSDEPVQPAVATSSPHQGVAVWSGTVPGGFAVLARERRGLGGPWRPAVRLSSVVRTRPQSPRVALNARGDAVVVWRLLGGAVQAATRRGPGGAWTRRTVARSGGSPIGGVPPVVAVDGVGRAVTAWATGGAGEWRLQGARLPSLGSAWVPVPALAVGGSRPALATSSARVIVAAWIGADDVAQATRQRTGRADWESPSSLSGAGALAAGVAIAPSGLAAASWQRAGAVEVALRALTAGAWTAPIPLGANSGPPAPVQEAWGTPVAVNGRGDLAVAWLDAIVDGALPARAVVRRSGVVSPPTTLDRIVFANEPGIVGIDRAGVAFAGWVQRRGGPDVTARFSVRPGAEWTPPRNLGGGGSPLQPFLAVAPGGSAMAIAGSYAGRSPVVAAYEPPSPAQLRTAVRGPSIVRAGAALTWRVLVRNVGGTTARGVVLRGRVEGPVTVSAVPPPTSRAGGALRWSLGAIGPRASRTITLRGRAPTGSAGSVRLSFTATLAATPITVGG